MSYKEPAEVVEARKKAFARMARLSVMESEKRRLKLIQEDEKINPGGGWLTNADKAKYDADQMAYVKPYLAEYNDSSSEIGSAQDNNTENEGCKTMPVPQDDASCAASVITENDTISSLPSIRGRIGRRGRLFSCRGSVVDYERTSTVQPPSEVLLGDHTSSLSIDELRRDYFGNYKTTTNLPIYSYRPYLINSINSYSVVIIEGATGCGKTTQVPMYILENAILDRNHSRVPVIYVTQPRRIAARSIAQRVCDEHDWEVGSLVGYQVGLEKRVGPQTVLIFCTAGVLLQKLIQDKSLKNYTHIIIDEAHERDSDTDLLMMMIRTLMRKEQSFFRLIVMSATMDMGKLKTYFNFKVNYGHRNVTTPSICKVGQEKEPTNIQVIYYDKLRSTFQVDGPIPDFEYDVPELKDDCLNTAVKIIIEVIPHLDTFSEATKSTLVFLPGLAEINKLHRLLKGATDHLDIIPLHSCLSSKDQQRVFQPARVGCRKVILATNIAESSITVHDVGFIIDFCLTKTLLKDEVTRFPTLQLQWSTMDKCTQRAGRTGRCCPGKVFRLVTHNFYKGFEKYAQPELLTAPLELSVLRVKNFQMGEIKALFAVVLDPPPYHEIRAAVLELKQIGALSSTYDSKLSDIDGDLTELGKVISILPIDVHLSKLIVIASVLDVLEDAIIVAACLSTNQTVVKHSFGSSISTYCSKLEWADGSYSDLFVSLDIYKEYIHYKDDQNKSWSWLDTYCQNRNLDEKKLHEVSSLVEELKNRLEGVNIIVHQQPNRARNRCEDELMLKIAFCASFYPNYFITEDLDAQEIEKSLLGLDPTKTVIVHNIPINQVPLYRSQIVQQLADISKDVDYISDCSRAFLVINDGKKVSEDKSSLAAIGVDGVIQFTPGIERAVFMAIKAFEGGDRMEISEYKEEPALERMKYYHGRREEIQRLGLAQNRLLPYRIKVVTGRKANNELLIESSNSTVNNYFTEIEFNEKQDQDDRSELYLWEEQEATRKNTMKGPSSTKKDLEELDHPLFKPGRKLLRGPYSPIQMSFCSVLERSRGFNVDIDPTSVNSILLDPDYEKKRRQMLISATVVQNKRNRVMARDTTLMPNIRGLPTLMALMFAQYYRVVYNEQMSCIAGAIFGLGWNENDEPVDKDYEVVLNFDVHVTKDDIELINQCRRHISELIKFIDVRNPGGPRAQLQQQLRDVILLLIRKRRYPLNEVSIATVNWSEGEFVKDKHNVPADQFVKLEDGQTRVFLPVMKVTKNHSEIDLYTTIRNNLDYLDSIEIGKIRPPMRGVRCLLCGNGCGDLFLIHSRIVSHIYSDSHIEKLKQFEIFEERAKQRLSEN